MKALMFCVIKANKNTSPMFGVVLFLNYLLEPLKL